MTQPATPNFGSDLSCVSDLTPSMSVVSGFRLVAEAIARRLQTPKGGLIDDANYGYDLPGMLNSDITAADLGRIAAGVQTECQKDQRVFSAKAVVTFARIAGGPGDGSLEVTISLTTAAGPFTLVLSVSQVTVSILSVEG